MKNLLRTVAVLLAGLAAVLVGRTLARGPGTTDADQVEVVVDEGAIARHLAEAIRIPTVSPGPPAVRDPEPFRRYLEWLEGAYPRLHGALRRDVLGELSVLFTWPGSDPTVAPILLTAHYDVVPVAPGSDGDWEHPPFSGAVSGGYVWGRGALDDKSGMIAILEAATRLLEEGFRPERTVYLAFGHDEEIGGREGAAAIVEHLHAQGVRLAWSLDEGSFVVDGVYPGIDRPVASINVAEKGYLTLDLVVPGSGGHSSMPPAQTAIGTLAAALVHLQANPLPGGLGGSSEELLDTLAGYMPFGTRLVFANRWLFGGLIEARLRKTASGNAMLTTTTAPTMLRASVKENVLPTEAVATVNFRVHPRDTTEGVVAHVRRIIDDDRVEVRVRRANEASRVSSSHAEGFQQIAKSVREIYGPVVVVPGLTLGGTDSRHYERIATDPYRMNPIRVTADDIHGFHGTGERIAVADLAQGTRAYVQVLRNGAGPAPSASGMAPR